MKKILFFLLILALLGGALAFFLSAYFAFKPISEPLEIVIPNGASMNYVAQLFYDLDLIQSKTWFNYQAKNQEVDRNIKPGTYILQPEMTLEDIFSLLMRGNPDIPVVLTIPEGWTLFQMAERVESLGFGSADAFLQATEDYFQEKGYGFDDSELFYRLEGYLYPDTYHFTATQQAADIVRRMATTMENQFTEADLAQAEKLGLTQHQVLTIASLIEREAFNDGEKAAISGVIHNRLKINMLLQIDATVIYAIGGGKEHITRVLYAHLEEDNPFNTYRYDGLPPGPIAAPGRASIEAALYPESHDFYYYVLGKDGHVFAKTYEEHLRNVSLYLQN